MIKTSAKTTSILAVAIAAILALCAVSGAIIYNNSSNNNTTDSGDSPVSPIKPIDDPEKVTMLPSSSSDLVTMLSKSGEDGNALLVDRLANNNYTFNGATCSITSNNDVAKYLYSLGYTVAGNHLAAEIDSQNMVVEDIDDTMLVEDVEKTKAEGENYLGDDDDDSSYLCEKLISKEDLSDVEGVDAVAKRKTRLAETATETSSFASLKDLTVKQFTSGSWVKDVENRASTYYVYFVEFADRESTVLNAMMGTPFSLDGKIIKTVADADDLAQMLYASGYEVVGTSLVDDSLSILVNESALGVVSHFKLANDCDDELLYNAPKLSGFAAMDAVDSISGPFYDLNEMTVELFLDNNFMMNEVRKAQASSDLETAASLSNTTSQKARVVAQYINTESRKLVASGIDSSVETMAALNLIVGTPFMTKDSKIAVISDADMLAQFFDSVGITVKDGRAIFYTLQQDSMVSASVDGMNVEVAYVILSENNCRSRCLSLEDIENAIAEKKAKAAEPTDKVDTEGDYYCDSEVNDVCAGVVIENKDQLIEFLLANGEMKLTDALSMVTYKVDGKEIPVKDENDMVNFLTYMGYGVFGKDGVMIELDKNWNVSRIISIINEDIVAGDFASSDWASLSNAIVSYGRTCSMDDTILECFQGTGFIIDGQPVRIDESNIYDFCEAYIYLSDINNDGVTDSYDACNSILRNVMYK